LLRAIQIESGKAAWKPHKATALEDTLDLDIFSPIREGWLNKDDAYLR
jgi:hypothetical protein